MLKSSSRLPMNVFSQRTLYPIVINKRFMSAFSQMSDNDPTILESEKQKQLSKQEKVWGEKLASLSEAVVKAERELEKTTKELQEETLKKLKEEY